MAKSSKKLPADSNKLAKSVVDSLTGNNEGDLKSAAAILGRKGGLKGGKARAEKLKPERRSEIAKKAAAVRWGSADKKK